MVEAISYFESENTKYLLGNHDSLDFTYLDKCFAFADSIAEKLDLELDSKVYHVMHGHQVVSSPELTYSFLRNRFVSSLSEISFVTGTGLLKESFWKVNSFMNSKLQKHANQTGLLICGHTHLPDFVENVYYNPGTFNYGFAQYLTLENGIMSLHKERY